MHVKKELIMLMKKRSLLAVLCISLMCCIMPVMYVQADELVAPPLSDVQEIEEVPNLNDIPVLGDDDDDPEEDPEQKGTPTSGGNKTMNSTSENPSGSEGKDTSSIISDGNIALMMCILVVAAGAVAVLFTRKRRV